MDGGCRLLARCNKPSCCFAASFATSLTIFSHVWQRSLSWTRLLKDFCEGSDDLDPEVCIGFLPDDCGAALTGICESPLPALLLFSSSPLSLVLALDCPWTTTLRTVLDVVRVLVARTRRKFRERSDHERRSSRAACKHERC
jgi:hypothetical protein